MTLKTIFKKPVDRPIEGVIKADDEASLRLEIEEYVLTNEVEKRLESFLDAYNNYEGANGVWVSGFFGSGKSHLLKMLALLLENRQIEGAPTLDQRFECRWCDDRLCFPKHARCQCRIVGEPPAPEKRPAVHDDGRAVEFNGLVKCLG